MSPGYFSRSTGSFHRYPTHSPTRSRVTAKLQRRNRPFWSGLRPLCCFKIRMVTMARKVRKKSSVICPSVTKYLEDQQQQRNITFTHCNAFELKIRAFTKGPVCLISVCLRLQLFCSFSVLVNVAW